MSFNLIKKYNKFLEIGHFSPSQRDDELRTIFNRDIADNKHFKFRNKTIRPLKKEGEASMDVLFDHLTRESTFINDKNGKKIKMRKEFDMDRSKRMHWVLHHIEEKSPEVLIVFSHKDRVKGKNVIRTYIYDKAEDYIVILEPQRSKKDYYLITAYYLKKEMGGPKQIKSKLKKKLPDVH